MQVKLLVEGGSMKPGPALSQKIGPLGLNMGKIIADVNKATTQFKGLKVPVILDIDTKTKNFTVEVSTPPASELLKKEAGITKGSGEAKKLKVANLAIEQIIKVAKTKEKSMIVNSLKSAVKVVVGTCVSAGILVESKNPKEILGDIDEGIYDKEINAGKEDVSPEKAKKLKEEFSELEKEQQAMIQKLKEEEEKKEAEKAAAAATTPAEGEKPAEGATPAEGAIPAEGAKPAEAKPEEKKDLKDKKK